MSKRGWDLFDRDGTGILELRRVDEDDVFENDDHAWRHFIYRLVYETDPKCARAAAELLNNWRPIMTDGMRRPRMYAGARTRHREPGGEARMYLTDDEFLDLTEYRQKSREEP